MIPESDAIEIHAARIRESALLGQARLLDLFNYLVESSGAGRTPKEVEIAISVFGRSSSTDLAQDASVRVYIHNLRGRLRQYYAGAGRNEAQMLVLPKGEYRLRLHSNPDFTPTPESGGATNAVIAKDRSSGSRSLALRIGAGALLLVLLLVTASLLFVRSDDALSRTRDAPFWSAIEHGDRPTIIVVGDYYIFGDTAGGDGVTRLIRDFGINSKSDLQRMLLADPHDAYRFQDVELSYLPTSSAYALVTVAPLFAAEKPRPRVLLSSELPPSAIKGSNLIYIGLLSGMGTLRNAALSASRFELGDSFDELIDRRTQAHYVSQATDYLHDFPEGSRSFAYRDYGYFSTFSGPTGNRIIVIAGMRDEGLRQTVDFLTDTGTLEQLLRQTRGQSDYEGLLEVSGMDRLNLSGKLLLTSPLSGGVNWNLDQRDKRAVEPSIPAGNR